MKYIIMLWFGFTLFILFSNHDYPQIIYNIWAMGFPSMFILWIISAFLQGKHTLFYILFSIILGFCFLPFFIVTLLLLYKYMEEEVILYM